MAVLWRFLLCVLFAPTLARAGAFMQPEGGGLVIAQMGFAQSDRLLDLDGAPLARAWRKLEVSVYGEYGLTDWITIIGEPSARTFRMDKIIDWNLQEVGRSRGTQVGASQIGARVRLFESGDAIVSGQVTLRFAPGGRNVALYSDMRRPIQVDVRALFGRRLDLFGWTGFSSAEFGLRNDGAFGHQVRMDFTCGVDVAERTTALFQSFVAFTPRVLGGRFALSQKAQASLVYALTPRLSLQVGASMGLRGPNARAERGLFSALWTRF